jgi:hypothetical protein
MYIGALAGLASLLTGIPSADAVRANVLSSAGDNAERIAGFAVAGFWITVAVLAVASTGLWVWVARMTRRGRLGARQLATVLFGLYTIFVVLASAGVASMKRGGPAMWASLATWLIAGVIVVLLYRRDTRNFWR